MSVFDDGGPAVGAGPVPASTGQPDVRMTDEQRARAEELLGAFPKPLEQWSIEERITAWRASARWEARVAEAAIVEDHMEEAAQSAALAAMYLALAADAARFGELPPIEEGVPPALPPSVDD